MELLQDVVEIEKPKGANLEVDLALVLHLDQGLGLHQDQYLVVVEDLLHVHPREIEIVGGFVPHLTKFDLDGCKEIEFN